jgi:hypothetical protein
MGKNDFFPLEKRRRKKQGGKIFLFMIGAGLAFSGMFGSPAQAQGLVKLRLGMTKLAPVQTTQLKGTFSSHFIKIPIPERWQIEKATLHFSYVNSTALLSRNSRLVVLLNSRPLAQVVLQPLSPVGDVTVSLPPRLLKPGYHDLEFSVSQHYTLDCEDPSAPELWTTLELDKSYIEFQYRMKNVPLQLKAISDFLFDPRMGSENRVNLVIDNLSPDTLELIGLIASGIAVRFDYRPVILLVSHTLKPGMDNVLVGDPKFVKGILGDRSPEIRGATVALMHLPVQEGTPSARALIDSGHALIIVAGEKYEQVQMSARTLASISFPYPGTASMEVKEIRYPAVDQYQGKNLLSPGEKYAFQSLGFETFTFTVRGMRGFPRSIDFRIPSHFMPHANEFAWVSLHMAYGSGMRKDSVLNVYFNDKYISSIFLENPQGGVFSNYQIPIPAYLIRRGKNTLTFNAVLTPFITGRCEFIQTENLLLTIYGDSSLKIPPMSNWVDLPRMDLFFQDGFPFTRWPDGREMVVYLAEKSLATVSAAMNLLAISAQKVGHPANGVRFAFEIPKDQEKEILAVGPVSQMSKDLLKAAPIKWSKDGSISYPQFKKADPEPRGEDSWARKFLSKFISPPVAERAFHPALAAFSQQVSGLGPERALLTQFQSPYQNGRSVLLLSADSAQDLLQGAMILWEPVVQGRIEGDLVILELSTPDFPTTSIAMGPKYYVGERGPVSRLSAILYTYPWLFLTLLIIALVILAYGIYHLLKKQRRKRVSHEGI